MYPVHFVSFSRTLEDGVYKYFLHVLSYGPSVQACSNPAASCKRIRPAAHSQAAQEVKPMNTAKTITNERMSLRDTILVSAVYSFAPTLLMALFMLAQ